MDFVTFLGTLQIPSIDICWFLFIFLLLLLKKLIWSFILYKMLSLNTKRTINHYYNFYKTSELKFIFTYII